MTDTLDSLALEITAWASATFPNATQAAKAEHIRREAEELCQAPTDVDEMADIFILLAHASAGHDLIGAVRRKLEINKRRQWSIPDEKGVFSHVRSEPEPTDPQQMTLLENTDQ